MEKTVKKLLTIIKKNYNGYPNEKLIIKFLSNIIYLIEDIELSDEKKIREIKYNINNLFPPREGLTEYYVFLENRKEMIIVNQEIKKLRENLYSLYRKIQKKLYAVKVPAGTVIYEGPVGYQGGMYLGGMEIEQVFIQEPWKNPGVTIMKYPK